MHDPEWKHMLIELLNTCQVHQSKNRILSQLRYLKEKKTSQQKKNTDKHSRVQSRLVSPQSPPIGKVVFTCRSTSQRWWNETSPTKAKKHPASNECQ